jgi:hypothetical protein
MAEPKADVPPIEEAANVFYAAIAPIIFEKSYDFSKIEHTAVAAS